LWLAVDSNIASIMPAELALRMSPCCLSRRRFLFHATECGVFAWRKKESHSKPLGIQLEKERYKQFPLWHSDFKCSPQN
jgi:hypothetical protein